MSREWVVVGRFWSLLFVCFLFCFVLLQFLLTEAKIAIVSLVLNYAVFGGRGREAIFICDIIVNRGDWFWSPANIKEANKDVKLYVRRSTTLHNLLFCAHTFAGINYVTGTFLLVRSSVRSKQLLCFVQGQGQKRGQKHTTKSFVESDNHSSLLIMVTYITKCFGYQ